MKHAKPLAFIDSGVGGIPYLAHLRTRLPGAPLVYVADNLNFPYGPKSESEIRQGVLAMTRRLLERYRPELVVVACNTASMLALEALRAEFDIDFVGVVPAVKPAALHSRARSIGVMATELIGAIERDPFMDDAGNYRRLLDDIGTRFAAEGVDTIVLGCTHFLMLKPELLAHFGNGFTILDSREGVTNRTLHLLEEHGCLDDYRALEAGQAGPSVFHLTADIQGPSVYERVAGAYGLQFGGTL